MYTSSHFFHCLCNRCVWSLSLSLFACCSTLFLWLVDLERNAFVKEFSLPHGRLSHLFYYLSPRCWHKACLTYKNVQQTDYLNTKTLHVTLLLTILSNMGACAEARQMLYFYLQYFCSREDFMEFCMYRFSSISYQVKIVGNRSPIIKSFYIFFWFLIWTDSMTITNYKTRILFMY